MSADHHNAPIIVAIDGPAGVGKSTTARAVAAALLIPFLDTGAMYRAIGWLASSTGVDPADAAAVAALLDEHRVSLGWQNGRCVVELDGEEVGPEIRAPEVGRATSILSGHPVVRESMVASQREFARQYGCVLEGRDIGTAVFPDTPFKFYLDASVRVRAQRRHAQYSDSGKDVSLEELEREIAERDERDQTRENSPLRRDPSHIYIDTSDLSSDVVVGKMLRQIRALQKIDAADP